ncbi:MULTISPECIES: hypothetical protein [unclassified Lentimonas]|uniref:hypothetical protein n=1 Tax=unclassified Lentimonas TaxID=2630993 RepID=UPI0013264A97|nr:MULTISPECIES: hypothetical protein [unclassified Lentimonas]CAA6677182.1 Unannotated [Lentimonas sp. CC4]CAA6686192.1 Unannotated [Lentimonas sp. CC6]CAA6695401.1 Unannotated [Lentimonas sp. CC10]CAA6695810.1 Unannotated [Lentimonas sp. CC19]CAA7072046.1 Unannotated [Lentimonas sp. CC11]
MKLKTLLLTVLAACLLPALAQAEGKSIDGDQDGNGKRKAPQSQEERAERFANADTNGDGQLSLEEVQSTKAKRLAENFDKIDTNGDGQLTKEELKAAHQKRGKGQKGDKKGGPKGHKNAADSED